ncbi:MAG: AMP-binding protein [Desulfobacterales bacterium]|nr:AMP-binding protein [Desulfobacterales bacterium]
MTTNREVTTKRDENVRVAVFMDNHPSFLYAFGGCAVTGGTLFGVNTGLRGQVLSDIINQSRCQTLIVDDRHMDKIIDIRENLEIITPDSTFLVDTGMKDFTQSDDIKNIDQAVSELQNEMGDAAYARPDMDVPMDATLMIIYTSGTTGLPKGIKNSQAKLMSLGMISGALLQLKPHDVGYACMPLFHSNAMFLGVMSAFVNNASIVIKDKFSASGFAPDILKYGVTYWNYVGQPVHYILLALEREYGDEQSIIKNIGENPHNKLNVAYGNGASQVDQDKFMRYFALEDMMEGYGSTEMAIAATRRKGDPRGSVGFVMDNNVKIYNDNGKECPPALYDENDKFLNYTEAVGEIVREGGPLPVFEGYHELPTEDSKKIRNGNYHSGDLGHIRIVDNKRYLYFDGRTDDWIRKDGENFSAENVAQVVTGFPPVELGVAFGVPCPVSDEWVMVALKIQEGHSFDPQKFYDYCQQQCTHGDMDKKWMPEFVRVMDTFEYTRTQKILVRPLKHEYYNLEWIPEANIYYYLRGFDSYKPFKKTDMDSLFEDFRKNGREQLLESWR